MLCMPTSPDSPLIYGGITILYSPGLKHSLETELLSFKVDMNTSSCTFMGFKHFLGLLSLPGFLCGHRTFGHFLAYS